MQCKVLLLTLVTMAAVLLLLSHAAPAPKEGDTDSVPFGMLDDGAIFSNFRCRVSLANITQRTFRPRIAACNIHI